MRIIILMLFFFYAESIYCQSQDSLINLIYKEQTDTGRIRRIYQVFQLAGEINPGEAIYLHRKVLELTKKQKDEVGTSVVMAELAYQLNAAGNNVPATELAIEALRLAEKTKQPQAIGIAYQNLGICYSDANPSKYKFYQQKAMEYSEEAGDDLFVCWELMNLSNVYVTERGGHLDSALYFADKAYRLAMAKQVDEPMPSILLTLSGIHYLLGNKGLSLEYIRMVERTKMAEKNNQVKCRIYEAYTLFYYREKEIDSMSYYAYKNLEYAVKSFMSFQIMPAHALKTLYIYFKPNADSALKYTNLYHKAKDSVQNMHKLQQVQALSFEETLRQEKIEEEKLAEERKRSHNLQYAAIAIGLIAFVILFITLSRSVIVETKFIKFFGILGLLAVFEFINLLIHPYLSSATNDSPVLMLLVLIAIAALLIPLHHKLEKWITEKMVEKNKKIRLEAAKKTIAKLEGF